MPTILGLDMSLSSPGIAVIVTAPAVVPTAPVPSTTTVGKKRKRKSKKPVKPLPTIVSCHMYSFQCRKREPIGVLFREDTTTIEILPPIPSTRKKPTAIEGLLDDTRRYKHIIDHIVKICKKHKPDVVVIEDYAFGADRAHASKLRELCGSLKLALVSMTPSIGTISPVPISTWKKRATGRGNSTKMYTFSQLCTVLNIEPRTVLTAYKFGDTTVQTVSNAIKVLRGELAATNNDMSSSSGETMFDLSPVAIATANKHTLPCPVQDVFDAVGVAIGF
jgi:hypothetical protein